MARWVALKGECDVLRRLGGGELEPWLGQNMRELELFVHDEVGRSDFEHMPASLLPCHLCHPIWLFGCHWCP